MASRWGLRAFTAVSAAFAVRLRRVLNNKTNSGFIM
jgi:hypothetical protein